jgi:hypothetical protein
MSRTGKGLFGVRELIRSVSNALHWANAKPWSSSRVCAGKHVPFSTHLENLETREVLSPAIKPCRPCPMPAKPPTVPQTVIAPRFARLNSLKCKEIR